jgi:WD40-like Beta Propeller Repeat
MKRLWTAVAVSFLALGVLAGCNDYNNTVQYNTGATITNIAPSGIVAGIPTTGTLTNCPNTPTGQSNPCFTLTVTASALNAFQTNTVVQWNGATLPVCSATAGTKGCSIYIDATDVSALVPYGLVVKPGTAYVNTLTPQSGSGKNGLSNSLSFIIYGGPNPFPTISAISPTTATVCTATNCPAVPITVTGTNFLPTSQNGGSSVTITGPVATKGVETAINVTSISSTEIKAAIPGTLLAAADITRINVINPRSGICTVNCPDLGGGDTNCTTPPVPANCVATPPSSNTFTIGGAPSGASSSVSAVAEEAPAVSQDGRYVVYASVQGTNSQILLRDTCLGAASDCVASTRTVSAATDGTAANGDSHNAVLTPDGRYVAFSSAATNLLSGAPGGRQIYLRDTCIGSATDCKPSTTLVSKDEEGKLAGTESILPSISSSGRFVAFLAVTANAKSETERGPHAAVVAPNSGLRQVFVRDTCLGASNCTPRTTRISFEPGDTPANSAKPAGPALAGLAKQIALSDGQSSTVFTPTMPIDDRVFLAIPKEN